MSGGWKYRNIDANPAFPHMAQPSWNQWGQGLGLGMGMELAMGMGTNRPVGQNRELLNTRQVEISRPTLLRPQV